MAGRHMTSLQMLPEGGFGSVLLIRARGEWAWEVCWWGAGRGQLDDVLIVVRSQKLGSRVQVQVGLVLERAGGRWAHEVIFEGRQQGENGEDEG